MLHWLNKAIVRAAEPSSHRTDTFMKNLIARHAQIVELTDELTRIWQGMLPDNYRALCSSHTTLTDNVVKLSDLVDKVPKVHPDAEELNASVPDVAHACTKRSRELMKLVNYTLELDKDRTRDMEELKLMLGWLETKLKNIKSVLQMRQKSISELEYYTAKRVNLENARNEKVDHQDRLDRTNSKAYSNERDVQRANEKIRLGMAKVDSMLGFILAKLMHAYTLQSGVILNVPFSETLRSHPDYEFLLNEHGIEGRNIESAAAARAAVSALLSS